MPSTTLPQTPSGWCLPSQRDALQPGTIHFAGDAFGEAADGGGDARVVRVLHRDYLATASGNSRGRPHGRFLFIR